MSSMSGWVEQELNVEKISQKWNNLRRKVKELKKQNLLDHAEKLEYQMEMKLIHLDQVLPVDKATTNCAGAISGDLNLMILKTLTKLKR